MPHMIVNMLAKVYNGAESCVRLNGQDLPTFPFTTGVQQGCVATPELFKYVIDNLMLRVMMSQIPSAWLGEYRLADLEYMDNTIVY